MSITTITSREFNQDVTRAKRAAKRGPVFITDRGRPAHVLLTLAAYERLTARKRTIGEALSLPEAADIKFEIPRFRDLPRPAEFD